MPFCGHLFFQFSSLHLIAPPLLDFRLVATNPRFRHGNFEFAPYLSDRARTLFPQPLANFITCAGFCSVGSVTSDHQSLDRIWSASSNFLRFDYRMVHAIRFVIMQTVFPFLSGHQYAFFTLNFFHYLFIYR